MSKAITPADEIRGNLLRMESQFKMALPSHISPEKFIRVAQTAIAMNPSILKADRTSLFSSCMTLAQQGLLPDGKEAALVCFGDKVAPMPMIAGIFKKLRNSGELSTIVAELVFEKDVFKYWIDSEGQHLEHRPELFGDRGKQIGIYALAKMKDSSVYIEVMSMADIAAVKKVSRSSNNGPWVSFEAEMHKKTVIRRLSKRLPMSTDIESLIKSDDELTDFAQQEPQQEVKTKSKRLSKLIKDKSEEIELEPEQELVEAKGDAPL